MRKWSNKGAVIQRLEKIMAEAAVAQELIDYLKSTQGFIHAAFSNRMPPRGWSLADCKELQAQGKELRARKNARDAIEKWELLSATHPNNSPSDWRGIVEKALKELEERVQAEEAGRNDFIKKAQEAISRLEELDIFNDQVQHMKHVIDEKKAEAAESRDSMRLGWFLATFLEG